MTFIEIALLGIGLSMDAMAVAIGIGLCRNKLNRAEGLRIGLFFGGFQMLMPLLGYTLGQALASLLQPIDHWVVFILLALIGGQMIQEGWSERGKPACSIETKGEDLLSLKRLTLLAVATSIDALAAGLSLALVEGVSVIAAVLLIGAITSVLSYLGARLASQIGQRFKVSAQIAGGLVLIGIGIKTLVEHIIQRI